jgi:hypothetical protein
MHRLSIVRRPAHRVCAIPHARYLASIRAVPVNGKSRDVWRLASVGALGGSGLLLAGLAIPWAGWYGINSGGFLLGLFAIAALAAGRTLGSVRAHQLAVALGALAAVLLGIALAKTPASVALRSVRSPAALAAGFVGACLVTGAALASVRRRGDARPRAWFDADRRHALAVSGLALVVSRGLVWGAGVFGIERIGVDPTITRPPAGVPFGHLGDVLTAPATAWDASSYLTIAQVGYAHGRQLLAFFPLYPDLLRAAAWSPQTAIVAGIALSLLCFGAALYLLHRLVVLDFERAVADRAVWLLALSPMALFFSTIYTESLFLALTIAAVYAARRGSWMAAGIAGALAAASRSTGILVLVPLVVVAAWGPGRVRLAALHARIRRADPVMAWLLLVPAGLLAYLVYCAGHGDLLAPFHTARDYWHRGFTPLLGALRGTRDAVDSARDLLGANALHPGSLQVSGQLADANHLAVANLTDFAALAFACVATAGVLRRLPTAYGAYAVVTLLATTSTYGVHEPLASIPRYLVVLFPCQVWLATWTERTRRFGVVVAISAALLAVFAARFAAWRWVA